MFRGPAAWLPIAAGSKLLIPWDNVSYGSPGLYSPGSPTRLTVQTRGLYQVDGQVLWDNGASGHRFLQFLVNGDPLGWGTNVAQFNEASNWMPQRTSMTLALDAGDYVELQAWHDTGATRSLVTIAHLGPALTLTRLGAIPGEGG